MATVDNPPPESPIQYNYNVSSGAPASEQIPLGEYRIFLEFQACFIALILMLAFLVAVTQNRLWHSNGLLKLFLTSIEQPLTELITNTVFLVLASPYRNDLYYVWAVLFMIGFASVSCISGYSLSNTNSVKLLYLGLFVYNLIVAFIIGFYSRGSKLRSQLWALWSLIMAKMIERFISFLAAERAYGLSMVNLVADYMRHEHELSNPHEANPSNMRGYKYLVHGEGQDKTDITSADYQMHLNITDEKIVTVEEVWGCESGLLSTSFDPTERLKEVSLSFALFKLLRRRFAHFRSAESAQHKTHNLVFNGLLTADFRVFRVVKAELGFLRDLFYTKYPIIFGCGFPIWNFIIMFMTLGVTAWLGKTIYSDYRIPTEDQDINLDQKGWNHDRYITFVLVAMILAMEVIEFFTYLFSDWAKVILTCNYVKQSWLRGIPFLDTIFFFIFQPKVSESLSSRMGQYSLLKNYNSSRETLLHTITCSLSGRKLGHGVKEDAHTRLTREVKMSIIASLRQNNGQLSNGKSSLVRHGVSKDLSWACKLPTQIHTIMVWHIATSFCEMIPPTLDASNNLKDETLKSNKIVATKLSKYCAYLLVFGTELLPVSSFTAQLAFNKIVMETRGALKGARSKNDKYNRMMQIGESDQTRIIDLGARLGKNLASLDEELRWMLLADFWAEFILYLAPSPNANAHLKKLALGGEFITHLWAILYHAGILERPPQLSA